MPASFSSKVLANLPTHAGFMFHSKRYLEMHLRILQCYLGKWIYFGIFISPTLLLPCNVDLARVTLLERNQCGTHLQLWL